MSCRNSRSQMFWKIDVLRTSKAPVLESLFNKVAGEVLRTSSLTEHLQWLLLWFLQQNNLIFSVITTTLGYIITKDCHGNTVIIITLPI